ncbi:hypothetical protein [Brevundimonas sp. GCM10030266]|uniref:hypothetical protein n=1 Tax=Brevundimonas sp. GCM10030266 TaxID=3273386 RepID=UPI00360FC4FE
MSSTSTPDWERVDRVTVANGLGFGENRIDTTNFDTPEGSTESISGPRPNQPLTGTFQDDPDSLTQQKLHEAGDSNTPLGFRLIRGTKAQVFNAVPVLTISGSVGGVVTYSYSLTPEAKPTRATVTP